MNTKLYSATLREVLTLPPCLVFDSYVEAKPDYLRRVGELQADLLRSMMQLVANRTFKLAATPRNRERMLDIARQCMRVLLIVHHRELWLRRRYSAEAVVGLFRESIEIAEKISTAKNSDYSSENISQAGLIEIFTRMGDKVARILHSLRTDRQLRVKDEKLVDTARDLVNYSIYLTMVLEDGWWVKETDRIAFQRRLVKHGAGELAPIYHPAGRGAVVVDEETAGGWVQI